MEEKDKFYRALKWLVYLYIAASVGCVVFMLLYRLFV